MEYGRPKPSGRRPDFQARFQAALANVFQPLWSVSSRGFRFGHCCHHQATPLHHSGAHQRRHDTHSCWLCTAADDAHVDKTVPLDGALGLSCSAQTEQYVHSVVESRMRRKRLAAVMMSVLSMQHFATRVHRSNDTSQRKLLCVLQHRVRRPVGQDRRAGSGSRP